MRGNKRNLFTTLKTEGGLLPADLLHRISSSDKSLDGLSLESYHLNPNERINEAASRSWNRLLNSWQSFRKAAEELPDTERGTTVTRERWLLILFQELGYGRLSPAKAIESNGRTYPISHFWKNSPIHLVGYRIDIDKRKAGIAGAARTSPHSLVQEFLNSSDKYLWGFVSNGLRLRILRDNSSLTRQAYVEFDLEAMMDGQAYSDFVMLWLLCHQSRVEAEKSEDCWLERWVQTAKDQGTRALDTLRNGVENAIKTLGGGFIAHPLNGQLREKLRTGALPVQDYYRQLLRLVYRLIFLFVAEDRDLLFSPEAQNDKKEFYSNYYSASRLRRMAERMRGTKHYDLYQGLRIVMQKLGDNNGCEFLGLSVLGSFLWSKEAISDLMQGEISNIDLLSVVRSLSFIIEGRILRAIDYRNLGAEELGSVYESLLELHPILNIDVGSFDFKTVSGHERKTTGSYYTPSSVIHSLLDSALEPVIDEVLKREEPEKALLHLKVCDPASGSGHFLIAAAHRLAKRLAAIRTGDDEPSPEATRKAIRDVIGHCIYGVDINPMAVELCKLGLWMEALEPGKPLSFLDHRILCGNSLLGATPKLLKEGIPDNAFEPIEGDDKKYCQQYKKRNKEEKRGQKSLFDAVLKPWDQLGNLATAMVNLEEIEDDTIEGIRTKQKRYEDFVKSSGYLFGRFLADAWCASFVWKKKESDELPYPITEEIFRNIEKNPHSAAKWMKEEVQRLASQHQFLHWHIMFPDVFRIPPNNEEPENKHTGLSGGFDVILGNPPWERVKLQEKEWFANVHPEIANASNASLRKRKIENLKDEYPEIYLAYKVALRKAEGESVLLRDSGRYPLCGRGDVNTYAVFAELNRTLINTRGRVGCIVPTGISTDDTTKYFFQDLTEKKSLVSLYDFENREGLFPGVHRSYKFCLLTLTGIQAPSSKGSDFVFYATNVSHLFDIERHFTLKAEEIALLNPNTKTCPIFRSKKDAEITKDIYRRVPVLVKEGQQVENPWKIWIRQGLYHMTNDSNSGFIKPAADNSFDEPIPLYEGKMFWQFDHHFAAWDPTQKECMIIAPISKYSQSINAEYVVQKTEFLERVKGQEWAAEWFLGFRNITNTTNERTMVASVFPLIAPVYSIRIMFRDRHDVYMAFLLSNFNSFIFDFVTRQKMGGTNLSDYITCQLPVFSPTFYDDVCRWDNAKSIKDWLLPYILELSFTALDLESFAKDCGYDDLPFKWDEDRRFLMRCEIDAAYFHLYEIIRENVDYIMDTFPIAKRKDEDKHGEYRTKRVILEIYDLLAESMRTGKPYQTRLDPPPADPSVAHKA